MEINQVLTSTKNDAIANTTTIVLRSKAYFALIVFAEFLTGLTQEAPLLAIPLLLVSAVAQSMVILIAYRVHLEFADQTATVNGKVFLRYIGASVLTGILVSAGFLVFVLPGVVACMLVSLSTVYLVRDDCGIVDSITSSWRTVWSHFLPVTAIYLITALVVALIYLLAHLLSLALYWPPFVDAVAAGLSMVIVVASLAVVVNITLASENSAPVYQGEMADQ